ncbi:hypothetical protein E4L95_20450 [Paracoccus liaowanqingii]|uniref:Uncharacterized protein n=1 Tax=Paracoccus liaowanqingii TaxID=2560053 RepID=A0A4Z1BQF3_9RHOB|nr:hypothetical protein [Paracoccus liaowanqingii]TGN43641.1 hypothetical protein E4L95_20450 [Paracoccus liaowanqingii]
MDAAGILKHAKGNKEIGAQPLNPYERTEKRSGCWLSQVAPVLRRPISLGTHVITGIAELGLSHAAEFPDLEYYDPPPFLSAAICRYAHQLDDLRDVPE